METEKPKTFMQLHREAVEARLKRLTPRQIFLRKIRDITGSSINMVGAWTNKYGRRYPSHRRQQLIADYYGVDVEDMFPPDQYTGVWRKGNIRYRLGEPGFAEIYARLITNHAKVPDGDEQARQQREKHEAHARQTRKARAILRAKKRNKAMRRAQTQKARDTMAANRAARAATAI